jgi:hypothetical protein
MKRHESRYQRVAEITYDIAKKQLPLYRHKNSPHHYTWPQLAACVLVMFYLDASYRDMEDWLLVSDKTCQTLESKEIPDHTTLCCAFHRLKLEPLRAMHRLLLRNTMLPESMIALDSTGFRTDQASACCNFRNGKPKCDWIKGTYAVGTDSQFVVAFFASYGRYQDSVLLDQMRSEVYLYAERNWLLLADAGFDGRMSQSHDIIPPVRRHGTLRSLERVARVEWVAQAGLDGLYGQRWKCEIVHSVIKRKFGDTIRCRSERRQFREIFIKSLIYNIRVF